MTDDDSSSVVQQSAAVFLIIPSEIHPGVAPDIHEFA